MSAYLAAVLADAPANYWRCADPGGAVLNDIGSTPLPLLAQLFGSGAHALGHQLSYSGPISDGGSAVMTGNVFGTSRTWLSAFPLTFEGWLFLFSPVTTQAWICHFQGGGGGYATGLGVDASGHARLVSGGGPLTVDPAMLSLGHWHHLVGTVSGAGAGTLYVDGVRVATTSNSNTANNLVTGVGGGQPSNDEAPPGAVAEVARYTTELSAARVSAHFAVADHLAPPVWSGQGGGTGGSTGVFDTGLLQEILQAVKRTI